MSRRKKRPWWKPRRSRRAQRWALVIVLGSLGAAVWAAHGAWADMTTYPDRPLSESDEAIDIEIPRGASLTRVLALLTEAGVLAPEEVTPFKLFVLHKGASNKITAGQHHFRANMTPTELLEELVRAQKIETFRVTIPEGKQMLQVADILAGAGAGDRARLEALMRDREFLARNAIEGPTAEGYLFPDTYEFRRGVEAEAVLERLIRHHHEVYAEVRLAHRKEARRLESEHGWGHQHIVTMASIIEKETSVPVERPRIAAVFLNRLEFDHWKPKRLETDPTIIYGCTVPLEKSEACKQFEGRIRRIHLTDKDNPYNTYTHEGLPPGPISNPGRAAIEAVLAPEGSRYLFFVARNDGTHKFSKTRAEHEAAVDTYIRGGKVGDGVADQE